MAGSEQRPTDDVLGHGKRLPPEDETAGAGGDRGSRHPDDTEGHMPLRRSLDTEAVDEAQAADDTEGHGRYHQDAEAVDEDQGDDTEGHAIKVRLGQDTEATDEAQAGGDDTEGHGSRFNG